jgi:uncharacterized protein (TIGR03000 family)
MYSIVLMAAIGGSPSATGADVAPAVVAPAAPVVVAGTGCCGGYAVSSYGCCGGYSYGCCGGKHGGGFLGHRRHSCCGGGCCGGYSYGCCGGYSSCCGGGFLGHKHRHSCHGCCGGYSYGCCGGGYGACWGYGYGYSYGCCGGGCYGSYSYPTYAAPAVVPTVPPAVVVPEAVPAKPKSTDKKSSDTGASLKFKLPASANLFVDGRPVGGDGAERAFYTPPLAAGQKYFYDVKAELVVDGNKVVEEKRVVVEAGADLTESFAKLFAAAGNTTTVAGK